MELHLTPEEQELLVQVLEEHHRGLLMEIFHTDHHHFKEVLKRKEAVLMTLLEKVGVRELVGSQK